VVVPAFVVGELRNAFAIGVALYLPFVAIDLAVAAILMGLGMFMLSPPVVALPCKLLLFVLVDGWALVCGGLVTSFR
jgi:flagellar biosynthetic protein FliP